MTLDLFESELVKAVGRNVLNVGDSTITPRISVSQDTRLPIMVVAWETNGPRDCHFHISPHLIGSSRVPYAAHRLSGILPLLEAFYTHALSNREATTGRVNINVDDHTVLPGLSFCARDSASFLVPDAVFVRERGYAGTRLFFANGGLPWHSRKPQAIWRGATTGSSETGWRGLPRVKLCELSLAHPDLLDARITSVVQQPPGANQEIAGSGLLSHEIATQDFGNWQIQIDIDGNTNSWPGLFQKLLTGSPVIKIASPLGWRQWYYDRLKAWENFIPAESDLSDLIEKLGWLREHELQAIEIGMAGRKLALSITYERAVQESVPTILAAMKAAHPS